MDHDQLSIPPLIRRQRQVLPSASPLRDLKRRWPDQGQGPEQDQRSCSDGPEVQATPPETGMV